MTTTTNIKLSTPSHGSSVDTWDADPLNNNSLIVDAVLGGVTSKALTNVNISLTVTESQIAIIRLSGILTGNVQITLPAIYKEWIFQNTTTGAFVITATGGSGNVVGLPPGLSKIFWDSANVFFTSLTEIIGQECHYGGTAVPAWITACTVPPYLLADGSTFSAVTYPALNLVYGGTTLPDARGRSRFNVNGGMGRITLASGYGIDGNTLFAAGGQQTLDQVQLPTVNWNVIDPGHPHVISPTALANAGFTVSVGPPGGNLPTIGASATQPAVTGITVASGGLARNLLPPGYAGGITMIRAA